MRRTRRRTAALLALAAVPLWLAGAGPMPSTSSASGHAQTIADDQVEAPASLTELSAPSVGPSSSPLLPPVELSDATAGPRALRRLPSALLTAYRSAVAGAPA